jgi:Holliday junction DNA helicase RuvA
MIHFIRGKLAIINSGSIVIENNGIGYGMTVPENSPFFLAKEGEEVFAYTSMIVREDDISLYGFSDRETQRMFHRLMSVSGVGAKAAMAILSALPLQELIRAILFEDAATLTRANGIGKKSAQRIVLELKDKVEAADGLNAGSVQALTGSATDARGEAADGLMALGYTKSEALTALSKIPEEELSAEEYIKKALKRLM